jgi:hypothetical protein
VPVGGTANQVLAKIDSTNYNTRWIDATAMALGGDLNGTIANGHVNLLTISGGAWNVAGDVHAADLYAVRSATSGVVYLGSDKVHYLYFDSANSRYQLPGASAVLQVDSGTISFVDSTHQITNSGGNFIYLAGSGQHYFWGTGSPQTWATVNTGPLLVNGTMQASGLATFNSGLNAAQVNSTGGNPITLARDARLWWGDANTSILGSSADANIYIDTWTTLFVRAQGYTQKVLFKVSGPGGDATVGGLLAVPAGGVSSGGNYTAQGVGSSGYAFQTANAAAAYGQGYANAWIAASSIDFKKNIRPLRDPLAIVMNDRLHGIEYDHDWELPAGAQANKIKSAGRAHSIGFVADYWLPHVPEVVSTDEYGKAMGMDYGRVAAIVFQALKEYIAKTDARLAALEAP